MKLDKPTMWKIFSLIAGGVFFSWSLKNFSIVSGAFGWLLHLLWPLILGFFVAFVLNLPMRFFENRLFSKTKNKKVLVLKRPICILLSVLAIFAILTLLFSLVIPELIRAVDVVVQEVPLFIDNLQIWTMENKEIFPEAEKFLNSLEIDWNETGHKLFDIIRLNISNLVGGTVSVVGKIVGGIFNAIMAFIFALYILTEKETLNGQIKHTCQAYLPKDISNKIFNIASISGKTFEKFISGQCLEACILGTLCCLGMEVLRLPYATMIGALVGFTALLPIVGAWIGAIVGVFMIGMESLSKAVIFIVFLLILQQVEGNLIYPRIVGSSVGLPPLWVLVAITFGGSIGGITGMLFAVPICSILYALVRNDVHTRLGKGTADNTI